MDDLEEKLQKELSQSFYGSPNPVKVFNFHRSLLEDFKHKDCAYRYLEYFLRDIPGNLGIYLRYHYLGKYFQSLGSNVALWPGIRIKHPNKMNVGNNTQLGYDSMYQALAGIKIGDNTLIGPGVKIWTVSHLYSKKEELIINQGYSCNSVEIGSDCWIASNSFIKLGTVIPNGCVVAAHSVVSGSKFKPYSVIMGNPAKVIGDRDKLGLFSEPRREPKNV
ncbi:acyltransferase [Candidatus Pacearchaeota archaeon]|nr:acyltransferase [Candidatus Pacearchaeota archaeon]